MAAPLLITGSAYEDSGVTIMARITGLDGAVITQGSISTITCAVFDPTGASVATPTVVVADSVFDALQTDARWTVDSTGYNFRYDVAASVMATGDKTYRFEFKFTPSSGEVFFVVAQIHAYDVLTS